MGTIFKQPLSQHICSMSILSHLFLALGIIPYLHILHLVSSDMTIIYDAVNPHTEREKRVVYRNKNV